MADEPEVIEADVAPAAETPVVETEAPPESKSDKAREQLDAAAKQSGWAPKDEWKGDPEDWIDAPEFILKAVGEVLPSMRKTLSDAKTEIASLRKGLNTAISQLSKADQRAYAKAKRDLEADLEAAVYRGDADGAKAVTQDIIDLDRAVAEGVEQPERPATDEHFETWAEANPWFQKDRAMTAAAIEIANEIEAETGLKGGKLFFAEVDKRVRETFPHKFTPPDNPNRRLPGSAEGPTPALRPRGKSFSDLPADAQAMCLELMKDIPTLTKEKYVKEYFS